MKTQTRKLIDSTIPFAVIAFGKDEIHQYWTKAGVYGCQVVTTIFRDGGDFEEYKTSGCGYCKRTAGLEWAFRTIGKQPKGFSLGGDVPYKYFVGGNFYKVAKSNICKFK